MDNQGRAVSPLALFELALLPLFGIVCLTIPKILVEKFSSRTPIWNTPTLTPGFYVIVGYFCLLFPNPTLYGSYRDHLLRDH